MICALTSMSMSAAAEGDGDDAYDGAEDNLDCRSCSLPEEEDENADGKTKTTTCYAQSRRK